MKSYGQELILDLKGCDILMFTREHIAAYFIGLCDLIDMKREDLYFWDDEGIPEKEKRTEPHVVGITAVQFIITSSITIHALTILKEAYINIFSCKPFDNIDAIKFTRNYFGAIMFNVNTIKRGVWNGK
jgi:S-adenosylmethionine/arginine decarboxylase-like enzyme